MVTVISYSVIHSYAIVIQETENWKTKALIEPVELVKVLIYISA